MVHAILGIRAITYLFLRWTEFQHRIGEIVAPENQDRAGALSESSRNKRVSGALPSYQWICCECTVSADKNIVRVRYRDPCCRSLLVIKNHISDVRSRSASTSLSVDLGNSSGGARPLAVGIDVVAAAEPADIADQLFENRWG